MDTAMLEITERQAKEIQFAIYYAEYGNHGTDGHNRLLLIAKMAFFLGFRNDVTNHLVLPEGAKIVG